MVEKVTEMVLKVDLQCASCYKKVKKVLCKFPQIRDQVYDEKANTVTITVVCCSPEKIRDKLRCKGSKAIKSIEIKPPQKPKEPEKPKPKEPEKPKVPEKPKETEKPKVVDKPKEPKPAPEKQKPPPEKPVEKPQKADKPPAPAPAPAPVSAPVPAPAPTPVAPQPVPVNFCEPVHGYPHMPMYPTGICCGPCSEGYGGGPCYHGHGRPVPPPPRPCYDGYGYEYGYGYRASRSSCSDYFSEENPHGCIIM